MQTKVLKLKNNAKKLKKQSETSAVYTK